LYGLVMKPMYGAAAMSLSSFCVCMNALRLNLIKVHDPKHDKMMKKRKRISGDLPETSKKEIKSMEKTVKIEGMMCPHCEARVKSALESLPGVTADVSHERGDAILTMKDEIPDEVIKETIEKEGYKVI
ncbi:MAG: cation transporter, partial [Clostridia bacterium]|nr:cation transporter [Clostridia bacterium]